MNIPEYQSPHSMEQSNMKKRSLYTIIITFIVIPLIGIGILFGAYCAGLAYAARQEWENNKHELLMRVDKYHTLITESQYGKVGSVVIGDDAQIIERRPTQIYDRHNQVIGTYSANRRIIVTMNEMSTLLPKSVLAMEDWEFEKHKAVDYKGLLRSVYLIVFKGRLAGGSTITQQLSKIMFTSRKRNLYRKFLELYGAIELEKRYTKQDILTMYLNNIYLGHGTYGVEAAAQFYFNKSAMELDVPETALLVGLIARPNAFSPFVNRTLAQRRQQVALHRMADVQLIKHDEIDNYYTSFWQHYHPEDITPTVSFWRMAQNRAPYFIEHIRRFIIDEKKLVDRKMLLEGSLSIYTTCDLNYQIIAERAMSHALESINAQIRNTNTTAAIEGAILVMKPSTGEVLAAVGGSGFAFNNQLDRTYQTRRQVGSTIKPLIYTVALDRHTVTPSTVITDMERSYNDHGRVWKPENYGNRNYGDVNIQKAVQKSINRIAVEVLYRTGVKETAEKIRMAVNNKKEDEVPAVLSLALGTCELTLFELANGYATLVNRGKRVVPYILRKIISIDTNGNQKVELDWEETIQANIDVFREMEQYHIFSPEAAYLALRMMQTTTKSGGTAYRAYHNAGLTIPVACKTGTTQNHRDAVFVACTPELVVVVRIGYDEAGLMLTSGMTGGSLAAPVAFQFLKEVYWSGSAPDFASEAGIVRETICRDTGYLPTSECTNIIESEFIKGTEPITTGEDKSNTNLKTADETQ